MDARSSFLCYPMIDTNMDILPRKAFSNDGESKNIHKSHLQDRNKEAKTIFRPTEYMEQYIKYNVEKAHSIPQLSHFKIKGDFNAVPEYYDSFKMYANYSKSAPIKKIDNLRMSGSEYVNLNEHHDYSPVVPEYRDKFCHVPDTIIKEKSLKPVDHLRPHGSLSKGNTEYLESFADPQLTHMPERGKCREPYLRLKGKLEFNPEYRNTYLDFPRARPTVKKPTSNLRMPISQNSTTSPKNEKVFESRESPDPPPSVHQTELYPHLTTTPEYRRANYHYQIRERERKSPHRNNEKTTSKDIIESVSQKKQRNPRGQPTINIEKASIGTQTKFAKYGRRASVGLNAKHRDKYGILEGNPKYLDKIGSKSRNFENNSSFLILDDMKDKNRYIKN